MSGFFFIIFWSHPETTQAERERKFVVVVRWLFEWFTSHRASVLLMQCQCLMASNHAMARQSATTR